MKVHPRVRKGVKWGGLAAVALVVVVWIGSVWWWCGWEVTPYTHIEIEHGRLSVSHTTGWIFENEQPVWMKRCTSVLSDHPDEGLELWPLWVVGRGRAGLTQVFVPLWIPLLAAAGCMGLAWRGSARARAGCCGRCGYDRAGLGAGAVCPECGGAGEVGRTV
jgi:hypothetical protein